MNSSLNLIPKPRLAARRRHAAMRAWVAGALSLAVVLVGMTVYAQWRWGGEPADLAAELDDATRRTEDTRHQLRRLDAELAAVERRLEANRAVTNQPNYAVLLALLARSLDDEVLLRSCAFVPMPAEPTGDFTTAAAEMSREEGLPPGFTISAAGLAMDQQAVSAYLLRLEQLRLFHRVRLINTRREPTQFGTGRAIAFEIECYLATGKSAASPKPQGGAS